ncbi:unnamed protein product [Nezara viridula]|uniref:Uncharacterized protein n=1 Tax=Nezara viridula TaxID=85310 RepID=A0A9P0H158_NEZVI|nr:unnamed protein product [Nezara viridula]
MCRGCPPIILGGLTLSYPRNVRGLPPRLQSPGCVGVVPLSFLAVLPYNLILLILSKLVHPILTNLNRYTNTRLID